MKLVREFSFLIFLALTNAPAAKAAEHTLELLTLSDSAWGEDWAGGCWFYKEVDSKDGGDQLMFLIRGEGKKSVAVFNVDGELKNIPYTRTIQSSKQFRIGARDTYLYQSDVVKVQVTTIVTEVPEGNECAGDCSESSGYAAEIKIQMAMTMRKYKFKTGACGL